MVDWKCPALAAALERWNRRDPAARRAPPAEPPRRAAEHRPGALGAWGPLVGQPCPPAPPVPAEPPRLERVVPPAAPVPAEPPRLERAVPPAAPVPAEPRPCPRCGKLKRCFCGIPR
jgi:hypothetical protein